MAVVQTKTASQSGTGNADITITFDSTATSGSLLVVSTLLQNTSSSVLTPSGWSVKLDNHDINSSGFGLYSIFWKNSDGTETAVTLDLFSTDTGKQACTFYEFDDRDTTDPFSTNTAVENSDGTNNDAAAGSFTAADNDSIQFLLGGQRAGGVHNNTLDAMNATDGGGGTDYTNQLTAGSGGSGIDIRIATGILAISGAPSSSNGWVDFSGTGDGCAAWLSAIKPSGAAPAAPFFSGLSLLGVGVG